MTEVNSSLSIKRIVISIICFLMVPLFAYSLNLIIRNSTVSWTIAINVIGCLIVIYDWNLIAIHYKRSKSRIGDNILFYVVGLFFIAAWTWLNKSLLGAYIPTPDVSTLKGYIGGSPTILLAYSFVLSLLITVTFKCLTDHLNIKSKEVQVILISGFLMATIFTVVFIPFNLIVWLKSYLYYVVLIAFMSYLYNQSSSFLPGMLSLGTVWLIFDLIAMFAI